MSLGKLRGKKTVIGMQSLRPPNTSKAYSWVGFMFLMDAFFPNEALQLRCEDLFI